MYKHNPLPFDISKYKNRSNNIKKRTIVFSSPKLNCLASTNVATSQRSKKVRSLSKQRSIHMINSKQKPKIYIPFRQNKSFQHSTAEPYQSLNVSPIKNQHQSYSPSYFNVSSLLKNKQMADSSLKESCKNQIFLQNGATIERIKNNKKSSEKNTVLNVITDAFDKKTLQIKEIILKSEWQSYEGQTLNSKFHGYGNLYLRNGDKFVGFFHHNQPQGHGSYYQKHKNVVVNGIWNEGRLVSTL